MGGDDRAEVEVCDIDPATRDAAPAPLWRSCGPCWRDRPSTATESSLSSAAGRSGLCPIRPCRWCRRSQRRGPRAGRPAGRRLAGRLVLAPPVAEGAARVETAAPAGAANGSTACSCGSGWTPRRRRAARTWPRPWSASTGCASSPSSATPRAGPPPDIAEFLQPYVDAGATTLNPHPVRPRPRHRDRDGRRGEAAARPLDGASPVLGTVYEQFHAIELHTGL